MTQSAVQPWPHRYQFHAIHQTLLSEQLWSVARLSQLALLDENGDALDDCVHTVLVGTVTGTEVHTKKPPERLPKSGTERAKKQIGRASV